jgi:hypothetical protein
MNAQPLIGDVTWQHMAGLGAPCMASQASVTPDPLTDAVVTGAIMVTCAFRLRDELGLIAALRQLTQAVHAMEQAAAEA